MREFKISPLAALERRRLTFLPPHLIPVEVYRDFYIQYERQERILKWIQHNLKSRFYYGPLTKLENNKIISYTAVAFEDPYESTLFLLSCPHLAKN